MTSKFRSPIFEAAHEMAEDLHSAGAISSERMKEYDVLCVAPVPTYSGSNVSEIRKRFSLTQAALASVLNTSISTVQKWEIGVKKPSALANKLLNILDKKGIQALL